MAADTSTFFGNRPPAAQFLEHGDAVQGTVREKELRQQTDYQTRQVKTWPDGRPMQELVVTLDDGSDDGVTLYVRGQMQKAIGESLRKIGARDLAIGDQLMVAYIGDGEARKGAQAPKVYKAEVKRPG
jgi:hypothetical protein